MDTDLSIDTAFRQGRRRLWRLCYRMTGVAADADEIVQEVFVRAMESGRGLSGPDLDRWLVRVATNLSLDCLRRRKRRPYPGSWLPAPVETGEACLPLEAAEPCAGGAGRLESLDEVAYAFLIALEALGSRARAALLLSDVLDYSAAEVARILETSEGNVRVLHHRARRVLAELGAEPRVSREVREGQLQALQRLLVCMIQQDTAGLEVLLAEDARSITDAGGRYTALREPLVGRKAVARFHLETALRRAPVSTTSMRWINGLAALVVVTRPLRPQMAPRLVLRCEVDGGGCICEIHTVLAPAKLTAVRFDDGVPVPAVV